jgi:hypothetical protein
MKQTFFIIILLLSSVSFIAAQTDKKLVLDENVPNLPSINAKETGKDISAADWSKLESALQVEDWTKTLTLVEEFQNKLDGETKDFKKARLRYIYLYSLAGKLLSYSFSGDREGEEYMRARLEVAAKSYVGREFVFPVRKILADCKGAVNYVCESTENPGFLRIAATNSNGTSVHLSEYIEMKPVKLDVKKHNNADVILGGILKGVRLNPEKSNKLIMTLQFEDGFVYRIYTN